jgi:hypothetical protein
MFAYDTSSTGGNDKIIGNVPANGHSLVMGGTGDDSIIINSGPYIDGTNGVSSRFDTYGDVSVCGDYGVGMYDTLHVRPLIEQKPSSDEARLFSE